MFSLHTMTAKMNHPVRPEAGQAEDGILTLQKMSFGFLRKSLQALLPAHGVILYDSRDYRGNIRSYGISMLSESLLRLPVQIRQDGPFLRIGRILPSLIRVTLQKTVITMSLHLLHLIPRHTSKECRLRQEELIR